MSAQFGDPQALPPFGHVTPADIASGLNDVLADHARVVDDIASRRPIDFAEAWLPFEQANDRLEAVWSVARHLHGVADTAELRAVFMRAQERLTGYTSEVGQNRGLYEALSGLAKTERFQKLPDADRRAVEHAVRGFDLAGVGLPEDARARFREVSVELSRLSSEFGSAVLDATDAWAELVCSEDTLVGLSDADKEMLAAAAGERGETGWLVTLRMPCVHAVLSFAEDRSLRERLYTAYATRASDQGPQAGQFDNTGRIDRILALRREAASLLGFESPAQRSLETKMATSAEDVVEFLRDLARRAMASASKDLDEIRQFAADSLGIEDLAAWDIAFVAERLRRERFGIDEERIRQYFPVDAVLRGWGDLLSKLYGITMSARMDVAVWHKDVMFFDVRDEDGRVIAGMYLDLYARAGKRSGAWMDQARSRLADGTTPIAYLVCNFAPPGNDAPSLLRHEDIVTFLHETGHVLHHLFTEVDRPSIAGTNGFEWDAIELPSQLMEDFAWNYGVLSSMSGHRLTGERLPPDIFERMQSARGFMSGMALLRQVEYALFDLQAHIQADQVPPLEVLDRVRSEVAVSVPPSWDRFPHAFNHIFAGEYAAGYYSYLWAEVLAADGFEAFAEAGLTDRTTGDRFRKEVLARGASRPASESFASFRGRAPDAEALLRRRGLISTKS